MPGAAATTANPLDWMTRDGKTSALRATKADWADPRFSPDGQKLALDISYGKQRGWPGIRLQDSTLDHIRATFDLPKSCAPYCTIGRVHRVPTMDYWRRPQQARVDADLHELVTHRS